MVDWSLNFSTLPCPELRSGFAAVGMPLGPVDTNAYIFYDRESRDAVIIDSPIGSAPAIEKFLEGKRLLVRGILFTHGHWDHMGGGAELCQSLQVPTWGSEGDLPLFSTPELMRSYAFNQVLKPVRIDHLVEFDRELSLGTIRLRPLGMTGHTPGGVAYYSESAGCVFSGDQLFYRSVGTSEFPGGDRVLLEQSVRKLYTLPENTAVLSGHGRHTYIGEERWNNPFIRG